MDANNPIDAADHTTDSRYGDLLAEVEAMFDDVLEKATIDAKEDLDRAYARLLVLTNELDERRITEGGYGLSTTAWLQSTCQMTGREASGTVKTARALAHMPQVADRAVTGEIVMSGVKLLAMTRDRHPDKFADHEAMFVDIAMHGNPKDLRIEVSEWEQDINYDEALGSAEYDTWGREVFFNQTYGGRWNMQAEFGVADGHVINTALQSYIQRSYINGNDNTSIYERLADATIAIHQFWLDHNTTIETSGGNKPHITVTVPYDVLTGAKRQLPELDGYTIDPATLRRWSCDAGIVRIILDGDSQPMDVGRRTRTIPPALRRALDQRDKGCVWNGCQVPASWCDAHHVIHWADGGDTNLENCQLLCRKHHTWTHQGRRPRPLTPREIGLPVPVGTSDAVSNQHRSTSSQHQPEP
ncbi:MAG: HNH endonuclease [Actinomycetia bacterium]|nr:HNH endonuclease [Actinomycetes bacterium]